MCYSETVFRSEVQTTRGQIEAHINRYAVKSIPRITTSNSGGNTSALRPFHPLFARQRGTATASEAYPVHRQVAREVSVSAQRQIPRTIRSTRPDVVGVVHIRQ